MTREAGFQIPSVIDVEASGFGPQSYPIEVGIVLSGGQRYCRLIKPLESWTHWTEEAEGLHGISRQLLLEKGAPVGVVCDEMNHLLAGQTVYSDGWVVDYPWMIRLFEACGKNMQFSVSPLEMLLSEYQMEHWTDTRDEVASCQSFARHRASSDAEFIQNVFVLSRQMEMGTSQAHLA